MQYNPLLLLTSLPILIGCFLLVVTDRLKIFTRFVTVLVTLLFLVASILVFLRKPVTWQFAGSVLMRADNLSAFIAAAVSLFAFLITLYSTAFVKKSSGRYFGYLLMTLGASFGVVYANNFMLMLCFWGFLAAMLYLMTAFDGSSKSAAAAKKALIVVGGTDALMIFGLGLVWSITGTLAIDGIKISLSGILPYIAYFSIAIAAFAKAGAVPFHSWLPEVAEEAPAPVVAYLPASLDKLLGIYLLARISLDIFAMNSISNMVLLIVGSATIIFAVIIALVQHNMKKLLGYHAVSQLGYMILGIGTANPIGIAGGLFHMLNHAVYKSCLFLGAGSVEKEAGTTDLDDLGGLAKYMPVTFLAFFVASLSISGIPPFNGFVSKWMVYQGILESVSSDRMWIIWLVSAMFGSALTIASFMKLLHAVFLGRASDSIKGIKEAPVMMLLPMAVLAVICILFGVLAYSIPIKLFIAPVLGKAISYVGTWNPILATALIVAGIVFGLLLYVLLAPKNFRRVGNFVGGEEADSMPRVSGTEFYDSIKDMKALSFMYKGKGPAWLDIYALSRAPVYFFANVLKRLHNGVLPTYLAWCLLGMVGMFVILFFKYR